MLESILPHLLAEATNQSIANPVDWLTYIGTVAPVTGLALYAWLQEFKSHRADNAAHEARHKADTETWAEERKGYQDQIQELNDKTMVVQERLLPVLVKSNAALEDALIAKRGGT